MTTASYFKTPGGLAGIQDTLQRMRGIVHKSVRDPRLIALARQLTAELEPRDHQGEIKVIFDWVRDNIRYASDIEGVETLIEPADLVFNLELGRQGDCDDFAMLLAALLKIMGYRARFKAGSVNGSRQGHVFVEVNSNGKWIPLDAIYRNNQAGYRPPNMGNFITVSVEGYKEDSMAGAKKDYVRLAVQDGKLVGMGLTPEAIAQLKKELPNMTGQTRAEAARILFHDALAKKGITLDGTVGADLITTGVDVATGKTSLPGAALETAASFIPGGTVILNIGKKVLGLFGGAKKAEIQGRKDAIAAYKQVHSGLENLMSELYKNPAWEWGKTAKLPAELAKKYQQDTWTAAVWAHWKYMSDWVQKNIYQDTTRNNTGGMSAVNLLMGYGWVEELQSRVSGLIDAYLTTEAAKLAPPPTAATVATVATELQTYSDPNSRALGNGIVNAQNQSYPTYPENTEIPAGAISIVGGYMGATPVRTVQPGDRVAKGETITSNVPIVIKNGVVTKSAGTIFGLPKNIVYIAGGSLAAAAAATVVIIVVKSKKGK